MLNQPVEIIQVPSKRLFNMKDATKYLGMHPDTLRKEARLGLIRSRRRGRYRVFTLEALNDYIDSLPRGDDCVTN